MSGAAYDDNIVARSATVRNPFADAGRLLVRAKLVKHLMFSNAIWSLPSSWVLTAVITVNLLLPVAHFWQGGAGADASSGAEEPAADSDRVPQQPVAGTRPGAAAALPAETAGAKAGPREPGRAQAQIAPVVPPERGRRVAMHELVPVCRAWGPFSELAEAETLAVRLHLDGDDFEVFHATVEDRPDYLVTVTTAGPRDEIQRTLHELQTRGVDSYILDRGSDQAVLAVGVFSNHERALVQQRRLQELGYEGAIEPLQRPREVYHLMARIPPDLEPEVPSVGSCSDIAPLEQFL